MGQGGRKRSLTFAPKRLFAGLESQGLKGRLWDVLDQDDDDKVTLEELVMLLNAMARGTLKDVTLVFFKMYDINHDGARSLSTPQRNIPGHSDLSELCRALSLKTQC